MNNDEVRRLDEMLGESIPSDMYALAVAKLGGLVRDKRLLLAEDRPLEAAAIMRQLGEILFRVQWLLAGGPPSGSENSELELETAERIADLKQRLDAMESKLDHLTEVMESSKRKVPVTYGTTPRPSPRP